MTHGKWTKVVGEVLEESIKDVGSIHVRDLVKIMMKKYDLSEKSAEYVIDRYTEDMWS